MTYSATVWSTRADESRIAEEVVTSHGEVLGRRYSNTITKCTRQMVASDGTVHALIV